MRKIMITMVVLVTVVLIAASAYAEVIDDTSSVTATAIIGGSADISALTPANIAFGTTGVDAFPTTPADQKVTISYTSNYNPWKIRIYTDNQIPAEAGRYSYGGLKSGTNVVPCKWIAQATATAAPAIASIGGYNFIKDLGDLDDPLTLDNLATPEVENNESWALNATTYANIAYGGPGGGVCVNPTNPPNYNGNPINGSIAVYIAGLFGTGGVSPAVPAAAGSYSSLIYLELYHE